MKIRLVALAALLSAAGLAHAQSAPEGNWMVRARAVHLDMDNGSDANAALSLPADAITVENKTIPEVDISYFFTPNIAAELVLTVPQKHHVYLAGTDIGTFKHLPPTLLAQYHFNPTGTFRPYVGAGVNYTLIDSEHLANDTLFLENSSVGAAVQVGFDVKLTKNMFLNVDLKKVQIRSDVKTAAGATVSRVKLDPTLLGVGLGWRF